LGICKEETKEFKRIFENLICNENEFMLKVRNMKQRMGLDNEFIAEMKEIEDLYIQNN